MLLYLNDIISATRSLANNGCFRAVTIPKHAELTADTEPAKAEGGVLSTNLLTFKYAVNELTEWRYLQ